MNVRSTLSEIDPAARAVAEVRAQEAGMTLVEWIDEAVYEHATPSRRAHHGEGTWLPVDRASGLRTYLGYGPDIPAYLPQPGETDLWAREISHETGGPDARDPQGSVLRFLTTFPSRIDQAAILLSAAFAEAEVIDFRPPVRRPPRTKVSHLWYRTLVDACVHRSLEVRNALVHDWTPSGRAEQLWDNAFLTLSDLTSAGQELRLLCLTDRARASSRLASYLELATQEFELSASLLAEVDAPPARTSNDERFAALRERLLNCAGGGVSLTEGSRLLGVSRQALHKRIRAGTALGMMDDGEIIMPRVQWVPGDDKPAFLPGLSKLVKLFGPAGGWSALQFLVESDPNLGKPPIESLRAGEVQAAVNAARAYLGLDEA